ncbi:hypothetical protein ABW19_dt0204459 [Dactylella cylindrospora]|nr:hypothetical protein ABW19_dt0204459 [Dactylella cylindrospora]
MNIESTVRTLVALSIFPVQATRFIFDPSPTRELGYLTLIISHIAAIYSLESDSPDPAFLCGFITILMSLRLIPTLTWEEAPELTDYYHPGLESQDLRSRSVSSRYVWGLSWITTLRGVDWDWQVRNVPYQEKYTSRLGYLLRNAPTVFLYGCVVDVLWKMRTFFDFTKYHGSLDGYGSSASRGLRELAINSIFGMISMYFITIFNYEMMAVVTVGLGLCRPKIRHPNLIDRILRLRSLRILNLQDWPPVLGPIKEAYTLRRFWSKTWHQLFRNVGL